MALTGIDISYAQATTPPLGAYAFVIVKATQSDFVDSKWAIHAQAVRAAGRPLGAYCFGVSGSRAPVATQAAIFLATASEADFLVLDLEQDTHWPSSMTQSEAEDFITAVHAAGRKIGLYHSRSGFPLSLGQDWNWVADYTGTQPSIPWVFWQYSDKAPDGSPLDLDKFNGDAAALLAFTTSQGDALMIYEKLPRSGTFKVTAGKTAHALQMTASGLTGTGATTLSGSGAYDFVYHRIAGDSGPTYAMHVASGLWAGFFISSAEIDEVENAPASAITQAQLDAAVLSGKQAQYDADAKSIAVTPATAKLSNLRPS